MLKFEFLTTPETVILRKAMMQLQVLLQMGNLERSPCGACMVSTIRRLGAEFAAVVFVKGACWWLRACCFRLHRGLPSPTFVEIATIVIAVVIERPLITRWKPAAISSEVCCEA